MATHDELVNQKITGESARKLDPAEALQLLGLLHGWQQEGQNISKTFKFEDFYETIDFVNAVAHLANRHDHHPDLAVNYNRCGVSLTSHSAGGLTKNDFILAAKIEALLRL